MRPIEKNKIKYNLECNLKDIKIDLEYISFKHNQNYFKTNGKGIIKVKIEKVLYMCGIAVDK